MNYSARPKGNTDAWYIVHRAKAKARMHQTLVKHAQDTPAAQAAMARFAYYLGVAPEHPAGKVAYQREAGRRGYQNRGWRSHHPSLTPPLSQYNHSDAKRKGAP